MDIFTKKAKEAEQQTNRTEKSAGSLDDVFRAISPSALSAVAGITALIGTVKALTGAFETAIGNYAHFEKLQMGLTTFFQDADKGKSKFEELRKLSNETTFGVDELTDAFTQFANVGVEVDSIKDKLIMIGNISQGDKEKFAGLVSIYSKIQSTGKAGAMQLAQIARQGIPIYDTLKKIGVQGTATGEDITKAFQEMTKEGAQFYNAMENINQTIEGKQGFISDYFKEMTVNFAEVTGLADAYKNVLDILKEAIGNVSDKLLEWNENPVAKAIIQGTLVTAIFGIGSAIVTSVIPALISTIAQLKIIATLKSAINPTSLLVGVGIAGIAGLVTMAKSLANSEKEINNELREQIKNRQELGTLPVKSTVEEKSEYLTSLENIQKEYEELRKTKVAKYTKGIFDGYFEQLAQYENLIAKAEEKIKKYHEQGIFKGGIENVLTSTGKIVSIDTRTPQQKDLENTERDLRKLKETYDKLMLSYEDNIFVKALDKNIAGLKEEIRLQKEYEKNLEDMETYSPYSKQIKEIKELETRQKEIELMRNTKGVSSKKLNEKTGEYEYKFDLLVNIDPKYKKDLDEIEFYTKQKIKSLKNEMKGLKSWEDVFENVTGIKVGSGTKAETAGMIAGKEYVKGMNSVLETNIQLHDIFNPEKVTKYADIYKSQMNKVQEDITRLMSEKKIDNPFTTDDSSIKEMLELYKKYKKEYLKQDFNEQNNTLDRELAILQKHTTELERQQELRRQALIDSGVSAENADALLAKEKEKTELEKKSTDIWGYLNDKVAEHFTGIGISEENAKLLANTLIDITKTQLPNSLIDGFTAIGTALETGASAGDALKKQFMSFVAQMMKSLSVTCIQAGVNLIAQSGWAGVPPALALFALGGASGIASGFVSSLNDTSASDTQKKELDRLNSLVKAYEDLEKAIKEQEEYYQRKRTELNAWTLKDYVQNARPVNDMILTPHGNFSTHPNDTIIATKNPESLGSANVKVTINNYSDTNVNVQQKKNADGMNELLVTISRKIASDVAGGYNGWDSAFAMQQQRIGGRRI